MFLRSLYTLVLSATLSLALLLAPLQTQAEDIPKLASDEAYLLLGLYVHDIIPSKIMLKGDSFLSTESMSDLVPGEQFKLIAVKPGKYTFHRVYNNALLNKKVYWDLSDESFSVSVEAGTISYGGHLISEIQASRQAMFRMRNRGSQAYQYLQSCCAQLLNKYPLKYTGKVSDPYLISIQGGK